MDFKIGDHVKFLRMSAKNISLSGTIDEINGDGKTVNILVDGTEDFIETAHVDDLVPFVSTPAAPAPPAEVATVTINEKPL
jgi:hypothetical protein